LTLTSSNLLCKSFNRIAQHEYMRYQRIFTVETFIDRTSIWVDDYLASHPEIKAAGVILDSGNFTGFQSPSAWPQVPTLRPLVFPPSLMKKFYESVFKEWPNTCRSSTRGPDVDAKADAEGPYNWSGFILQGEWK